MSAYLRPLLLEIARDVWRGFRWGLGFFGALALLMLLFGN